MVATHLSAVSKVPEYLSLSSPVFTLHHFMLHERITELSDIKKCANVTRKLQLIFLFNVCFSFFSFTTVHASLSVLCSYIFLYYVFFVSLFLLVLFRFEE